MWTTSIYIKYIPIFIFIFIIFIKTCTKLSIFSCQLCFLYIFRWAPPLYVLMCVCPSFSLSDPQFLEDEPISVVRPPYSIYWVLMNFKCPSLPPTKVHPLLVILYMYAMSVPPLYSSPQKDVWYVRPPPHSLFCVSVCLSLCPYKIKFPSPPLSGPSHVRAFLHYVLLPPA